jgi:hypothetical protein
MFLNTVVGLHAAFGVDYETNVLGLDGPTFAEVLATTDALQLAPDAETTAYGTALTGRGLQDDVIDVTLILTFGGMDGARFDGEDGTPELVSDIVGEGDRMYPESFPYMTGPNN